MPFDFPSPHVPPLPIGSAGDYHALLFGAKPELSQQPPVVPDQSPFTAMDGRTDEDGVGDDFAFMRRLDCGKSTCFAAIYYDPVTQELRMRFRTGPIVYSWAGVPKGLIDHFAKAESKGGFYWDYIRGRFLTDYPHDGPSAGRPFWNPIPRAPERRKKFGHGWGNGRGKPY